MKSIDLSFISTVDKHNVFCLKAETDHQYLIRDWPGYELIGAALINCNNIDSEQWPLGSKFPPWDVSSKVIISALSRSGQCKANTPRSVGCIDSVCQWPKTVAPPSDHSVLSSGHLSRAQYYIIPRDTHLWQEMDICSMNVCAMIHLDTFLNERCSQLCLIWVRSHLAFREWTKYWDEPGNTFISSILLVLMMYGNTPIGYLIIPPFPQFRDMHHSFDPKGSHLQNGFTIKKFSISSKLGKQFKTVWR